MGCRWLLSNSRMRRMKIQASGQHTANSKRIRSKFRGSSRQMSPWSLPTACRPGSAPLGAGKEWFKPWRTITGREDASAKLSELQIVLQGVFDKQRFLDLLRY